MSELGNLEWYDKNVKTPRVLELEAEVARLRAELASAHGELAGHALMDAEGEAFLPEVVTQLRAELQEAVDIIKTLHMWFGEPPEFMGVDAFLAKHT